MAKLNGVKTLDMVNGEITKVEYDGAVYAKVEGEAKKGDIALILKEWGDQNEGEFYNVINEDHCFYDGNAEIIYIKGAHIDASNSREHADVFRKVEESFKVGDYVKIVGDKTGYCSFGHGDIVKVVGLDGWHGSSDRLLCEDTKGHQQTIERDDVVKVTEKDDEPKPKFKVGDYVKAIKSNSGHVGKIFVVTRVFDQPEMYNGITYTFEATPIDDRDVRTAYSNDDRSVLATEEEIAAAKTEVKWAKIGRQLNEFKVGDIIHVDATSTFGVNTFGEVVREADEDGDLRVEAVGDAGDEEEFFVPIDKATLVTPVESRFDR